MANSLGDENAATEYTECEDCQGLCTQYLSLATIPTDEMVRNTKDEFPCLAAAMEFYFEFLLSTSTMEFH